LLKSQEELIRKRKWKKEHEENSGKKELKNERSGEEVHKDQRKKRKEDIKNMWMIVIFFDTTSCYGYQWKHV
jgi:hypothetical protein